jgi:DNA-binding PadR family transcriptional regulator
MVGFGNYPVDSSAIYRILRQLETAGMVTSRWDTESTAGPPRRVYCLTEAGNQYLAAWVGDLRATDGILHHFLDAYDMHMRESNGEHSR